MMESGLLEHHDDRNEDIIILIRKRSNHRLKSWNSTTDTRSWSLNGEERRKYILNLLNNCQTTFGNYIPFKELLELVIHLKYGSGGNGDVLADRDVEFISHSVSEESEVGKRGIAFQDELSDQTRQKQLKAELELCENMKSKLLNELAGKENELQQAMNTITTGGDEMISKLMDELKAEREMNQTKDDELEKTKELLHSTKLMLDDLQRTLIFKESEPQPRQSIKEDKNDLNIRLDQLLEENKNLKDIINKLETHKNKLENEIQELSSKGDENQLIEMLQDTIKKLENEIQLFQSEITNLSTKLRTAEGKNVELEKELSSKGDENQLIEMLQDTIKKLENEIQLFQSEITNLSTKLRTAEGKNVELEKELSSKGDENQLIEMLQDTIKKLENEIQLFQSEITNLSTKLRTAEDKNVELEKDNGMLRNELEKEEHEFNERFKNLKSGNDSLSNEIEHLKRLLDESGNQKHKLAENLSLLENENAMLKETIENLKGKVQYLKTESDEYKQGNSKLREELEGVNKKLQETISNQSQTTNKAESLETEIEKLKKQIKDMEDTKKIVDQKIEGFKKELKDKQNELESCENIKRETDDVNIRLEEELQALKMKLDDLLSEAKKETEQKLQALKNDKNSLKNNLDATLKKLSELQTVKDNLEKALKDVQNEAEKAKADRDSEIILLKQENEKLNRENKNLMNEVSTLNSDTSELQNKLEQVMKDKDEINKELDKEKENFTSYKKLQAESEKANEALREQLENIRIELEQYKGNTENLKKLDEEKEKLVKELEELYRAMDEGENKQLDLMNKLNEVESSNNKLKQELMNMENKKKETDKTNEKLKHQLIEEKKNVERLKNDYDVKKDNEKQLAQGLENIKKHEGANEDHTTNIERLKKDLQLLREKLHESENEKENYKKENEKLSKQLRESKVRPQTLERSESMKIDRKAEQSQKEKLRPMTTDKPKLKPKITAKNRLKICEDKVKELLKERKLLETKNKKGEDDEEKMSLQKKTEEKEKLISGLKYENTELKKQIEEVLANATDGSRKQFSEGLVKTPEPLSTAEIPEKEFSGKQENVQLSPCQCRMFPVHMETMLETDVSVLKQSLRDYALKANASLSQEEGPLERILEKALKCSVQGLYKSELELIHKELCKAMKSRDRGRTPSSYAQTEQEDTNKLTEEASRIVNHLEQRVRTLNRNLEIRRHYTTELEEIILNEKQMVTQLKKQIHCLKLNEHEQDNSLKYYRDNLMYTMDKYVKLQNDMKRMLEKCNCINVIHQSQ